MKEKVYLFNRESGEIEKRIKDGLIRITLAVRHKLRNIANSYNLSVIQAQILIYLSSNGPQEICKLSQILNLTPATVSDSLSALKERHLVKYKNFPYDRRKTLVSITAKGKQLGNTLSLWTEVFNTAINKLSSHEKETLLGIIIKIILVLLGEGVIQEAKMCLTCSYFRPFAFKNTKLPHYCALAKVPLGIDNIRLNCPEHEMQKTDTFSLADKVNVLLNKT
jgi:DNA-binding MarR family transcriptional regulator